MQSVRQSTIHDSRYQEAIQVLIKARKASGLSQTELAQKLHLSQPDISKIERLERRLDITEFFDILEAIANGDRSVIDQIWNEIHECHCRSQASRNNT